MIGEINQGTTSSIKTNTRPQPSNSSLAWHWHPYQCMPQQQYRTISLPCVFITFRNFLTNAVSDPIPTLLRPYSDRIYGEGREEEERRNRGGNP